MKASQWTVGDFTVTSIVEEEYTRIPPEMLFPRATAELVKRHSWLVPDFADEKGRLVLTIQAFVVDLAEIGDRDEEQARATRHRLLELAARERSLFFGTHFSTRPAGRIEQRDGAFRFIPVEGRER